MTRRDMAWRGIGVGAFVVATALGVSARGDGGVALGLPAFCLAIVAIVLVVQGSRVPAALRVERSHHRALAQAIRDRRRHPGGGSS